MGNNRKLRDFYILWSTQSLSHLGSAMTSFALTLWLFDKTGSALSTAALTICTYAPGPYRTNSTRRRPCWSATRWQR